jgi:hypothetical protein
MSSIGTGVSINKMYSMCYIIRMTFHNGEPLRLCIKSSSAILNFK